MPKRYASDQDRITHNVSVDADGCWNWRRARDPLTGYGRIQINRKTLYTHRFAYQIFVGPIPEGLHMDHLCRNRACCNPQHLEPVTCLENVRRSPIGNGRKTHCPQGHEYGAENTRVDARGCRICRTCNREKCAAWRAARKPAVSA